jgi:SAM-dependent methyltransferase
VGCGTGISTRFLSGPGVRVIGVDPNPDMLEEARRSTPDGLEVEYRTGEAAATGLPARSADLVTAAQAFHWFEVEAALAEFRRILRPGGACAAFWNLRDDGASPFLAAYQALLLSHSTEYGALEKAEPTTARILGSPALRDAREAEFAHVQRLDREGLYGRVYSSSYVVHGVPEGARPAFDAELGALFDRHQRGGEVEFVYRTRVLAFRIAEDSDAA